MATTKKTATPAAKRTTRTRTPKVETPVVEEVVPELTEEQRQAQLQAFVALKSAGLPVPADIEANVARWQKEEDVRRAEEAKQLEAAQAAYDEANEKGPWYVRNIYNAPQSLRLDRQTEKRRIELKARGVPGDMHPLLDGDLDDPILKMNLTNGLIEVIPAGEAKAIIAKQMTNINERGRVHSVYQILRNEKGEEYKGNPLKVELEFNQQGITVAQPDPRSHTGQLSDKELGRAAEAMLSNRNQSPSPERGSTFVPTAGNPAIISDGYTAMGSDQGRIADDIARRRGDLAAQDYVKGLTVTVAPPQKG